MFIKVPLLLIGYENHKIEILVQLHNEKESKNSVSPRQQTVSANTWLFMG